MQVNLDPSSWLNLINLLSSGEYLFWESVDFPEIPLLNTDSYIQINREQAKRIDLLAYDTYGDSGYFWFILLANNIDYPSELYEGMTIRLPAKETIDQLIQPPT